MFAELLSNFTSILQSNLYLIVLIADFFLKSALIVLTVLYFDRVTSPYFSNNQKYWLWLVALLMLSVLPFTMSLFEPILAKIPGEPELTLFTVLVSADQVEKTVSGTVAEAGFIEFALAAYAIVFFTHLLKLAVSFFQVSTLKRYANFNVQSEFLVLLDSLARKKGIRRKITLAYSSRIDSPATYGLLQPGILLPESMRFGEIDIIENVLIHELAHIKRGDSALYMLAYLLAAASWFNPFAWIALKRLNLESEFACDSEVIAHKDCRKTFARQLVALARAGLQGFKPELASRSMYTRGQLFLRVDNIMHANYRSSTGRTHSSFLPLLSIFIMFCWASTGKILALGDEAQFSSEALRLVHAEIPHYPQIAIDRGATGFAQFRFTVDRQGNVDPRSVRLVNSEPPLMFEDSSVAALEKFQFAPRRIKGRRVATQDIHYTFQYQIKI